MKLISTFRNWLFSVGLIGCAFLLLLNVSYENPAYYYTARIGEVIVKNPTQPDSPVLLHNLPMTFQNNNQAYSTLFLSPPTGQIISRPVPVQNNMTTGWNNENLLEWVSALMWGAVSFLLGASLLAAIGVTNSLTGIMH